MNVTTSNTVVKPQYVTITSLVSGGTYTGTLPISGTVTDANKSGFDVANATITAYVYGPTNQSYSNDSLYQQQYHYLPVTYGSDGVFSFNYDFQSNYCTYIRVNAWDRNTGEQHFEEMYVNCTQPHIYAKPGASTPPPDAYQQWLDMQQIEATDQFLLDMQR